MSEATYTGQAVEAMCKLLRRFADRGRLAKANRWGIVVHYNKKKLGLLAFEFITKDNLHVQLEFEMQRLKAEGKDYIDNRMELLITQLEAAREAKQEDNRIVLFEPKKKQLEQAVIDAMAEAAPPAQGSALILPPNNGADDG